MGNITNLNNTLSTILPATHLSSLCQLCLERTECGDLGFCLLHALLSTAGSAREEEDAALIMAFAGLSVSGMNKHL